jgi:preprotein translocase SecE subunit
MTSNQKYVNALFIFAAAVVWLISSHYTQVVVGYFQLGRSLGGTVVDLIEHGVPLAFALVTFLILRKNKTSSSFSSEAILELVRVHWPVRKDVTVGTIVVIITVITAGVILGFLDMGLSGFIRVVIGA